MRRTWSCARAERVSASGALEKQPHVAGTTFKAIGGEVPRRIVGVWLIAVSAFQRGSGVAAYRETATEGIKRQPMDRTMKKWSRYNFEVIECR